MRLTKTIRDSFVRAVMHDVPQVDYEEEAHKLAKDAVTKSLPPSVQKMIKDPQLSHYVNYEYVTMPQRFSNFYCACAQGESTVIQRTMPEVWAKIMELHAKHEQQIKDRNTLRYKLEGVANSVSTRKSLIQALPEFEKYLPADEEKAIRSLPVVANVVADFTKAGWPAKGKK